MSSVSFGCTGPYTLGPCLRKCFRMHTQNGKGAYTGVFLSFRRLGASAGACAGFLVGWSCTWEMMEIYKRKCTSLPHVPTHAYAGCIKSGQQPTRLYKEFPGIHDVGHSTKTDAQMGGLEQQFWHLAFTTSAVAALRVGRLGWFPSQANWRRTRKTCHWPWDVKSLIRKAVLPKHNTSGLHSEDGWNLQLCNFIFSNGSW